MVAVSTVAPELRHLVWLAAVVAITTGCGRFGFDTTAVSGDASPSNDGAADGQPGPDAAPICPSTTFVQSGEVDLAAGAVLEVAITTVDPSCSFVVCERRTLSSSPRARAICDLPSPSKLSVESGEAGGGIVRYQIVTSASLSVARGVIDIAALDVSGQASFPAVVRASSFALVESFSTDPGVDADERATFSIEMLDESNIVVRRGEAGPTALVAWQVVEVAGATVRQGRINLAALQLSGTAVGGTVSLERTFLVTSVEADNDTDGEEAAYQVRAELLDPQTVQVTRMAAEDPLSVSFFAVELPLGGQSEQLASATMAPHSELALPAAVAIDLSRAFAIGSATIDAGIGRSALGSVSVTRELIGDQLVLRRLTQDGSAVQTTSFVVSLGP